MKIAKRRGKIKREITSIRLARLEDNRIIKEGDKIEEEKRKIKREFSLARLKDNSDRGD